MNTFIPLARNSILNTLTVIVFIAMSFATASHQKTGSATYLANEGIMVEAGGYKVLFDPFFHNDYGNYQLVPSNILDAIMSNSPPYNNIDAIFVSHAHGDHFAAQDMLDYLQVYSAVKLIAPTQAIQKLSVLAGFEKIQKQLLSIALEYGDTPQSLVVDNIEIDAVRIPHAGWPGRADVSNIVFRVSLPSENGLSTFVHMGDADPNDEHFRPYSAFWQQAKPDFAFPPYWFFQSIQGNYILNTHINAEKNVGVHVPVKVPESLKENGEAYFSVPGEKLDLVHKH